MGKIIKISLILLGIILLIVLVLGVYLIVNISDDTNNVNQEVVNRNMSLNEFLNVKFTESLADAENKDRFDFLLSEVEMNTLAYALFKDVNLSGLKIFGSYLKYEDDGIYLKVPMKYYGVKTCLVVKFDINFENSVLMLDIQKAKLGKLDATSSWVLKTFVFTKSLGKSIETSLKNDGIYVNLDMKALSITVSTEEISKTISSVMKNDPNAKLFSFICNFCLNNEDTISFNFGKNSLYGLSINTGILSYNEVRDEKLNEAVDYSLAKSKTITLLSDKVDFSNVSVIYNYFVNGFDALDDESKNVIANLQLDTKERGLKPDTVVTIFDLLIKQRYNHSLSILDMIKNIQLISLTDEQLNSVFTHLDFVGYSIAFTDGSDIAYITLRELDVFFNNNYMGVNLIIDFNGKLLTAHIDSNIPDNKLTKVVAEVSCLRLGEKEISGDYSKDLMDYLTNILEKETWITPNSTNMTITIDLKELLSQISEYSRLLDVCNSVSTRVRKTTNGYIEVVLNPFS